MFRTNDLSLMPRPGPRTTISSLRTTKETFLPLTLIINCWSVYRICRCYGCAYVLQWCFTVMCMQSCLTSWFTVLNNFIRNWVTVNSQDVMSDLSRKRLWTVQYNRHTAYIYFWPVQVIHLQTPFFQLCQNWNGKNVLRNLWNIWACLPAMIIHSQITNFFAPEKKMCRRIDLLDLLWRYSTR